MITIEMAQDLRRERGLLLPPDREYETPRLKEIAKRQSELMAEFAALDRELFQMGKLDISMDLKWVTNIHDPKTMSLDPDLLDWLQDKVIGEPSPSDIYSVEDLKEMGIVGVYAHKFVAKEAEE